MFRIAFLLSLLAISPDSSDASRMDPGNTSVNLSADVTGTLPVENGGTETTTLTQNGLLYGNGTSAVGALPAMGANGIITGSGTGVIPSTGTLTGTANEITLTKTGSNIVIDIPTSPTLDGTNFTGVAAAGIASGNLGSGVIASSVAAVMAAGTFGSATIAPRFNVGVDGRITSVSSSTILPAAATNLDGGAAGNIPIQSGVATTVFLPTMADGGIIVGNGAGLQPSTGTLVGTSNQVTVTKSGSVTTLATPQSIATGSTPQFARIGVGQAADATIILKALGGSQNTFQIDGTIPEMTIARGGTIKTYFVVPSAGGQFITGSAQDDTIIRSESAGLVLNIAGTQASSVKLSNAGNLIVGSMNNATSNLQVVGNFAYGSGATISSGTTTGRLQMGAGLGAWPRTIAQLQGISPEVAGDMFYCSNCSPAKIVVATGTSAGNFADAIGGEFK